MAYLLERDALNGKEGRAIATINGKQIELFGCKNVKADYSLDSADLKLVGTRLVQKKTTGIQLSGSMTIIYGTPYFKQLVKNYMTTGAPPYFTLQIINDDPATSVGRQVAALYNCRINSGNLVNKTHQEIAYELNSSRVVISRLLKALEKEGFLDYFLDLF